MNKCPKCGEEIRQGDSFCRICGASLLNSADFYQQNTYNNENNNLTNNNTSSNNSISTNVNNISTNNTIDEELIDAYIGKNADKIKKGGFSICTFFFGSIYVLYRKFWLVGFCWLFGGIAVGCILPGISSLVSIGVGIWISIEFNKWYLKDVTEKVNSIKNMNPNMSREQLIGECRKKGGTTIIPVVIFSVLTALFIGLIILLIIIGFSYEDGEYGNYDYNYENTENYHIPDYENI